MRRQFMMFIGVVLAASLVSASMAEAAKKHRKTQVRYWSSAQTFRMRPPMAIIPDTRVYYLRDEADYDLYQHGSSWYLVDNGVWYRASSWRGPFARIRTSIVPREVLMIPAGYRREWVYPASSGARTQFGTSVRTFFTEPRMAIIPETRVYYDREESDYDLYRYGGFWYLVDDGQWYRARSWRGPFVSVRTNAVPREVLTIPAGYRRYWVSPYIQVD